MIYIRLLGLYLLVAFACNSSAAETSLTWYGHSAFRIVTPQGIVLLIDPWITNPQNPEVRDGKNPLDTLSKVDYILVTHAHYDHVGDSVELARRTGAILIAQTELSVGMVKALGFPEEQVSRDLLVKTGVEVQLAGGTVAVSLTPAAHGVSMALEVPGSTPRKPTVSYGGTPTGVIVEVKDGPTFYHTGDTAYFEGIGDIGKSYKPDVMLVNIDAPFGVDAITAARLVKFIDAKLAIPHHYGTYQVLTQDPEPFFEELRRFGISGKKMVPGETIYFDGKEIRSKITAD